jgi:hypothetical protein
MLGAPKKKKMKKSSSKLMEPTASSMMKDSSYNNSKKEITHMGQWINDLRGLKPPPKRSRTKSKKKKGKGLSLKSVARTLKEKFRKNKKKQSKKKKPISKSRSKTKGKPKKRGKTVKKGKTPKKKKTKKGKKSKTPAKKKKKKITKKKKKKPPVEKEEGPKIEIEKIMLGGNMINEEEEAMVSKNRQFVQELKVSTEPEITELQMYVGGDINRENEKEQDATYSMANNPTQFELQNQEGLHHFQYETGDGENEKLEFGPEDQIIEHIFTMHWSQVDKILIRAKIDNNVAPPSKRMTIMQMGKDIYSKQRILLENGNNVNYPNFTGTLLSIFLN